MVVKPRAGSHANNLPAFMTRPLVIAIDGPAGSGKSTVAQKLAERLGLTYVDSGATYRAAALKALESGIRSHDGKPVIEVIGSAGIQFSTDGSRARVPWDVRGVSRQ